MKSNRVLGALGLILLVYMSLAGQYLNNETTFDSATVLGLIDVAIVSFIMMIVPCIMRIINKRPFEYKRGQKICRNNSLILFGISILLMIITDGFSFIGGIGALVYYFVNMLLFSMPKEEKNKKNEVSKKVDTTVDNNIDNKRYCSNCGKKIEDYWEFCNYCGKKIN